MAEDVMRSPLSHHIERSVMNHINVTEKQFKLAQERLASFLEEKYNIKKQSNGLIEFGAAFVLGFDNHHQLNAALLEEQSDAVLGLFDCDDEDEILFKFSQDDSVSEFVLGNRQSSDFTDSEILDFVLSEYEVSEDRLTPYLLEGMKVILNQSSSFRIKFYNTKESFDKRVCDAELDGYTFFSDAMQHCYELIELERSNPLADRNFYAVNIHDQEYDIDELYKYKSLASVFKDFESVADLQKFYLSHLLVKIND